MKTYFYLILALTPLLSFSAQEGIMFDYFDCQRDCALLQEWPFQKPLDVEKLQKIDKKYEAALAPSELNVLLAAAYVHAAQAAPQAKTVEYRGKAVKRCWYTIRTLRSAQALEHAGDSRPQLDAVYTQAHSIFSQISIPRLWAIHAHDTQGLTDAHRNTIAYIHKSIDKDYSSLELLKGLCAALEKHKASFKNAAQATQELKEIIEYRQKERALQAPLTIMGSRVESEMTKLVN